MNDYYPLPLALGTLAVSSGLVILIIDVISIVLYSNPSTSKAEVLALVSSTFHGTTLVLMSLLLYQYFRHHNMSHPEKLRPRGYLIAFAGASCIISSIITALELVIVKRRVNVLPWMSIPSPPKKLIIGALISGAASMLSQCIFVICLAALRRKKGPIKNIRISTPRRSTDMQSSVYTRPSSSSLNTQQKHLSMTKSTISAAPSSKCHSDAIFEKSLVRFSLFPIRHKRKIVPQRDQLYSQESMRSQVSNAQMSAQSNRDNGDTISFELQSPQFLELLSSQSAPRAVSPFQLETIPASPTDPTCGGDLSPEPPPNTQPISRLRENNRSFSSANSFRESKRYSRSITPVETNHESHIHPLFRTDSSEPPPTATPGTVVTAAPGAGQVISDHASIRSLRSKKSVSSLQSRRNQFSSNENLSKATEGEKRTILQL